MKKTNRQRGFTMIEVMVSIAVLTIGLVSMLSLFTLAIASTHTAREDAIAKQEANEALENIFTARNSSQTTWAQIQNVANGGIFSDGYKPIKNAGPDGLDGTVDDGGTPEPNCPGPSQCVQLAGPDGILGTSDDTWLPLNNFERQIVISPLFNPDGSVNVSLRQVTVSIRYTTSQYKNIKKVFTSTSYISQYR